MVEDETHPLSKAEKCDLALQRYTTATSVSMHWQSKNIHEGGDGNCLFELFCQPGVPLNALRDVEHVVTNEVRATPGELRSSSLCRNVVWSRAPSC